MSRGSLENAWDVIEKIREEVREFDKSISALQMESNACKIAREALDSDIIEMCDVLKNTEKKLSGDIDNKHSETKTQLVEIKDEQKKLLAAYHEAKGRENASKWIPTLIQCAVGLSALYLFIKGSPSI